MRPLMLALVGTVLVAPIPAQAYVALMAEQQAKPLQGQFNSIPVLHSNQPEEVLGPGILVTTTPGSGISAETQEPLENATYTFNGEFGLHVHHKYNPQDRSRIHLPGGRRGELPGHDPDQPGGHTGSPAFQRRGGAQQLRSPLSGHQSDGGEAPGPTALEHGPR